MRKRSILTYRVTIAVVCGAFASAALASGSFEQALQTTMKYNPAISGKQSEVNAKGFGVEAAEAAWLPSASTEFNNLADNVTQGQINIDQPLWSFGRIESRISAAKAEVVVDEMDLLRVQRELLQRTALAYANVKAIEANQVVAQSDIEAHKKLLAHVERRSQGLMASDTDVSLAQSRLVLAQARDRRYAGQLKRAKAELIALTVKPVATEQSIPEAYLKLPSENITTLALRGSADIANKEAALASAKHQIQVAKTETYPTLMLRGEHELLDNSIAGAKDSRLGLVFSASFNGLGQVGASNTRAAEARYQATLDDLAFTQNTIVRDVDTLLSDLETAEALAQGQVDVIDSLSDTLTSYERQYDSGFKSWLDLLNMQRELTEQKLQLVLFENQQVQARAILTAMTGGFDAIAGIGHAQSQTRVKER